MFKYTYTYLCVRSCCNKQLLVAVKKKGKLAYKIQNYTPYSDQYIPQHFLFPYISRKFETIQIK